MGAVEGGAFLLDDDYVEAVERAGAAAIMLPTAGMLAADPSLALDRIDVLVLTGGCDVDLPRHLWGCRTARNGTD